MTLARKTPLQRTPWLRARKPLPLRSAKRAAIRDERRAFMARILSERRGCEGLSHLRDIVHTVGERDQRVVLDALRACNFLHPSEVHEKRKRSRGGSITDDANVLALCRSCHAFTEAEPRLSTLAGMLTPSWQR